MNFFKKENNINELDERVVNNLKCLSIDMIYNAGSGHPGSCLSASKILYTLFAYHLNFNRKDLKWVNRDRFVLSSGHIAPLYYSLLYMMDLLTLDDLKSLRRINSLTPGMVDINTPLVETTTGPLGQGVSNAVGMAISERYLNSKYKQMVNYYTYCLCGDGCLMEGISYEALSLAAKLNLNKLIILYDYNKITLDGKLSNSQVEDPVKRFKALGFNVITCDGNNIRSIDLAITKAKSSNKPSIIICDTIIGIGSINEGTNIVHGIPLTKEDISNIKNKLDMYDTPFTVSIDSINYLKDTIDKRMNLTYKDWVRRFSNLKENKQDDLKVIMNNLNTYEIKNIDFPYYNLELREISSNILNEISKKFDLLIGGASDVASSTNTILNDGGIFDSNSYSGRNICFGVREHAMAGIANGMALSGLRPFVGCLLTFMDYLKPALKMTCLMNLPVLYIFTHDSITIGPDGKAHQPIYELASLELMPNLYVYRPFDVNELLSCYKDIFKNKRPSCLVLPKNCTDITELTKSNKITEGAYILKEEQTDDFITLFGNGEEMSLIIKVAERLSLINIDTRIVSIPVPKLYKGDIIPKDKLSIGITFTCPEYFYKYTNHVIGISEFGKSGTREEMLEYFEFTEEDLYNKVLNIIEGEQNEK